MTLLNNAVVAVIPSNLSLAVPGKPILINSVEFYPGKTGAEEINEVINTLIEDPTMWDFIAHPSVVVTLYKGSMTGTAESTLMETVLVALGFKTRPLGEL